jgi:hypothetical protein
VYNLILCAHLYPDISPISSAAFAQPHGLQMLLLHTFLFLHDRTIDLTLPTISWIIKVANNPLVRPVLYGIIIFDRISAWFGADNHYELLGCLIGSIISGSTIFAVSISMSHISHKPSTTVYDLVLPSFLGVRTSNSSIFIDYMGDETGRIDSFGKRYLYEIARKHKGRLVLRGVASLSSVERTYRARSVRRPTHTTAFQSVLCIIPMSTQLQ